MGPAPGVGGVSAEHAVAGRVLGDLREDGVGVVTPNRPAKLNAVMRSFLAEPHGAVRGRAFFTGPGTTSTARTGDAPCT
ncbi:hypothetical protein [Rhodococcus sp. ACT016]|uniref:hypothetical protein n=1 Tax=Rhodococcus sp. ACT016 TaxID=3134808 RepID=UPI003D2A5EB6